MTLQEQILQYIEKHLEAFAYESGTFILVCARGCFIGIEAKQTRRDKASPIQKEQIIRIVEAGGHGWFIRDFETFRTLFEGIYNGSSSHQTKKDTARFNNEKCYRKRRRKDANK